MINNQDKVEQINQERMLKYYQEFDPIQKKYGLFLECETDSVELHEKYLKFNKYESNRQFAELTKKEFGDIYANLELIYSDETFSSQIIEIYDLVCDKVITQYLNIDGLERLFNEKYINFEWEMHLGIDYAGHSMKFYRDHFIHQVRDAYSMDILLQHGYDKQVMEILRNQGNSKISRYVGKHIGQQLDIDRDPWKVSENIREEFYLQNVIYMSSYMCALFHDIGYPEVANIQSGRNILAYIANVYNFGSGHIDFDKIFTVLQNSLLFRVVSPKEIRNRIDKDKIDHGTISALMFLLHFYENGSIYGLEPYKKCAVELAGLAIYNHTNAYAELDKKKEKSKASYDRNVFVLNPISYLLRICDDLQEWDRVYFEISSNANIILCNKCHTPIVRHKKGNDVYYLCNCNKVGEQKENTGIFSTVFPRGSFPYRRLYNITVCTNMNLIVEDDCYTFHLQYDLERLLYVAYINPSYAKYRINELNQLKKMFVRQDIDKKTFINYFMSCNIILIKAEVVRRYMRTINLNNDIEKICGDVKGILEGKDDCKICTLHNLLYREAEAKKGEVLLACRPNRKNKKIQKLNNYLEKNFIIYVYIALVMEVCIDVNEKPGEATKLNLIRDELCKMFSSNKNYDKDVLLLLEDCFKQAVKLYNKGLKQYLYYPDEYFEQFSTDEGMRYCFARFAQSDYYIPLTQRDMQNEFRLDAYTDLYCFHTLLQKLKAGNKL